MNIFKAGDKVYCPTLSLNVLTVESCNFTNYFPLRIVVGNGAWESFSTQGLQYETSPTPFVFHATEETHKKLCDFYGVEFEEPNNPKEAKEIVQVMLDDGWEKVPVYYREGDEWCCGYVSNPHFTTTSKPFDPKTGKIIIDYVDGQMILES